MKVSSLVIGNSSSGVLETPSLGIPTVNIGNRQRGRIISNNVINSNNCLISVCKSRYKDKIIVLSAIDNLIKGGSGQALQNFNIKFNFNEKLGLIWKNY